jgi:hypothetical protein
MMLRTAFVYTSVFMAVPLGGSILLLRLKFSRCPGAAVWQEGWHFD